MKIVKGILVCVLLLMHGIIFCAQAEPGPVDLVQSSLASRSDRIKLIFDDGYIKNVSVTFLIDNFDYFSVYFENWEKFNKKDSLVIEGSVKTMFFLLAFSAPFGIWSKCPEKGLCYLFVDWRESEIIFDLSLKEEINNISLMRLADFLCLKQEKMERLREIFHFDELYQDL